MTRNLNFATPEFGKAISKADADKLFDYAREIENGARQNFETGEFSERELAYFQKPCLGYIFSQENLKSLLSKMQSENDYLVMLNGAKSTGQKTLIVMVYTEGRKENSIELNQAPIEKAVNSEIGTQHPGIITGEGEEPATSGIPIIIDASKIDPGLLELNDSE